MRESPLEYVDWQITALHAAKWAGSNDPRVGHGFDGRRNVLVTSLANDHEWVETGGRGMEHKDSIGE